MYDINTKNIEKGKKIYLFILALGLLFLITIVGILVSSYLKLNSLDSKTTPNKIEINSHYDEEGSLLYSPIYYYTVNGEDYTCHSNSSSSIIAGSSSQTVYYDSKDPATCMTEYSKSVNNILLISLLLPFVFILIAVINMRKISKRVKLINSLNKNGKLVKNLQYYLENTATIINGVPIKRPVIEYTFPSGSIITLYGDPRHDRKSYDDDGMVDLVIDENNPSNYFINFEINRLTGNLPADYYNQNQINTQDINNNNF